MVFGYVIQQWREKMANEGGFLARQPISAPPSRMMPPSRMPPTPPSRMMPPSRMPPAPPPHTAPPSRMPAVPPSRMPVVPRHLPSLLPTETPTGIGGALRRVGRNVGGAIQDVVQKHLHRETPPLPRFPGFYIAPRAR